MSTSSELGSIMKPASGHTCGVNRAIFSALDFSDQASFDDAARGLIGSIPSPTVTDGDSLTTNNAQADWS